MKNLQFMNLFTGLLKNSLFGALFSTVNLSKKIPNDQIEQNFYLPDVFFYQFGSADSDVISYSSNSKTLTTTDLNLKIKKHILIKMFKSKIYSSN